MGFLRLLLALLVVIQHLGGRVDSNAGRFAVFGFYVLSGYLITRVMCETYFDGPRGLVAFALNRFLRIYPTYWFVLLCGCAVVAWAPDTALRLNDALVLPTRSIDTLAQFLIFGLHRVFYVSGVRLVPTAWSLNVELIYYALIAVALGRKRWIALAWWIASLALSVALVRQGDFGAVFSTIWGPSICFATGAVMYHVGRRVILEHVPPAVRAVPMLLIGATAFAPIGWTTQVYLAIPLLVLAIALLQARTASAQARKLDRLCGDLSYPVFLSQWLVAVVVARLCGLEPGLGLLAATLPVLIAFSWTIIRLIESPIAAVRNLVRAGATNSGMPAAGPEPRPVAPSVLRP